MLLVHLQENKIQFYQLLVKRQWINKLNYYLKNFLLLCMLLTKIQIIKQFKIY